jgi:hypothetical protein
MKPEAALTRLSLYDRPVLQTPVALPNGRVQVAAIASSGSRDRMRGRS